MNHADFDALPDSEKKHFYRWKQCGEMVEMRPTGRRSLP
jgi:hypothetical protein